MPDPIVLQIADNLIAKSAAAGFVSTGLLTDVGKMWADEQSTPAGYLGDLGESSEFRPTQRISPRAGFFLHCIIKGSAPMRAWFALYKAFKDLLGNDPGLGGLVELAHVVGYQPLNTAANISQRIYVADIFIEAEYKHERGAA